LIIHEGKEAVWHFLLALIIHEGKEAVWHFLLALIIHEGKEASDISEFFRCGNWSTMRNICVRTGVIL
jgi:hypothetical protein